MVFYLCINLFSVRDANCLQIRTKSEHRYYTGYKEFPPEEKLLLVHKNGFKWYWGPSARYGFHCFNELQPSKQCPDFEYRLFTNCN